MGPLKYGGYFCHGEIISSRLGSGCGSPSLHGGLFFLMADIHWGGLGVGPGQPRILRSWDDFFQAAAIFGSPKKGFPCRPPKISINQLQGGLPLLVMSRVITLLPGTSNKQPFIDKWLFQWDDSKSLYGKWLFHQTSMYKWLFEVPGISRVFSPQFLY